MKQRIGVYNKKIVVAGDENLAGPNEIHISKLNGASSEGGSGSGSDGLDEVEYFKLEHLNDSVIFLPSILVAKGTYFNEGHPYNRTTMIASTAEVAGNTITQIACYNTGVLVDNTVIKGDNWKQTAAKYLFAVWGVTGAIQSEEDALLELNYLTPITKEEFYTLEQNNIPQ